MDILSAVVLRIPCPSCGRAYEVPVAQVLASQEMVNEDWPCRSENECPPVYLSSLLDHEELKLLADTWLRLREQATSRGGQLFLRTESGSR